LSYLIGFAIIVMFGIHVHVHFVISGKEQLFN